MNLVLLTALALCTVYVVTLMTNELREPEFAVPLLEDATVVQVDKYTGRHRNGDRHIVTRLLAEQRSKEQSQHVRSSWLRKLLRLV